MQRYTLDSPEVKGHRWFICPDYVHLYGFSGGDDLGIDVSTPSADGSIGIMEGGGAPFVDHLRNHILRRAGFGWEDDEDADFEEWMPIAIRDQLVAGLRPF